MAAEELKSSIEQLSSELVLADLANDETLGELQSRFAAVADQATGRGKSKLVAIAQCARDFLEGARQGNAFDIASLDEVLSTVLAGLKGIVCEKRNPGEVAFAFRDAITAIEAERGGERPSKPELQPVGEPTPIVEVVGSAQVLDGDLDLYNEFVVEAREHLESVESALLELEQDSGDADLLNGLFRSFHTIKGVAAHLNLADIMSLSHEVESLLDLVRGGERSWDRSTFQIVFESQGALSRLMTKLCESLEGDGQLDRDADIPQLIVRIRGLIEGRTEADHRPSPTVEPMPVVVDPDGAAVSSQSTSDSRRRKIKEFMRVDSERLSGLVETIGEMVTAVSVMQQYLASDGVDMSATALTAVDKISRELQELGTSLRMVPLRSTFQKMKRMVRDLSEQAGKPVELHVSGEDTELDKSMVERLSDPLIHLMRNAVDHGIEFSAADRERENKPKHGTIELRAFHQGGNIYLEVEDDGAGIDRRKVLNKARLAGLVGEDEVPNDRDLFGLIFEPGFSTAQKVSSVSGRGVGMDVVKRNIEDMRGTIEIQSEEGLGTLFSIRLPLTIAIIDGMVVRVGEERYIVPTLSIIRSVRPSSSSLSTVFDTEEMIEVQGALIPLYRVGQLFGIADSVQDPSEGLVVVVEFDGRQFGLLTDELLGQQQVVIKSLGASMEEIPGISGGAVMADGRVGLIVDVAGLVKLAQKESEQTFQKVC